MLYVLNLRLRPEKSTHLTFFSGLLVLKLFLRTLSEVRPELARELHESKSLKPYTCAPLWTRRGEFILDTGVLRPEYWYYTRIVFVRRDLLDYFLQGLEELGYRIQLSEDLTFYLYPTHLRVLEYSDLEEEPTEYFTLEFRTPTRFAVRRSRELRRPKFRLFPLPEHVAHSLVHHWNRYAPPDLRISEVELLTWVRDYVYEVSYRIRKLSVKLTRGRIAVGFVGFCRYRVEDVTSPQAHTFFQLLRYGELVNVGNSKSMGLGLVKLQ